MSTLDTLRKRETLVITSVGRLPRNIVTCSPEEWAALLDVAKTAEQLAFEARYFDDHTPEECAIIRAAGRVEAALARLDVLAREDKT